MESIHGFPLNIIWGSFPNAAFRWCFLLSQCYTGMLSQKPFQYYKYQQRISGNRCDTVARITDYAFNCTFVTIGPFNCPPCYRLWFQFLKGYLVTQKKKGRYFRPFIDACYYRLSFHWQLRWEYKNGNWPSCQSPKNVFRQTKGTSYFSPLIMQIVEPLLLKDQLVFCRFFSRIWTTQVNSHGRMGHLHKGPDSGSIPDLTEHFPET